MTTILPPVIDASDLLNLYLDNKILLLDVSNGKNAKENYVKEHIDGAQFVDLNTQLADVPDNFANGGRHPLPSLKKFSNELSAIGITPESHVILYDDKNGANAAARFWWMLQSIGHEKVQVINGGFAAAKKVGIPTNNNVVIPQKKSRYPIDHWQLATTTMEEVSNITCSKDHKIIDVRESFRYLGIEEPIDILAGHIPSAINIPFTTNLNPDGTFLSIKELQLKYEKVVDGIPISNVVVHCGSGVTACHTLLAFARAGLQIPKLYVGSWSEWSRNGKTIEKTNPQI